jgi:hypothetical protein
MSVCNFTQQVGANQCIGDSLVTFNTNFSALDQGLCEVPSVIAGLGTMIEESITEQQRHEVQISTKNSFTWQTDFESTSIASPSTISLLDGTSVKVTTFPYVSSTSDPKPLATFSTICLTDRIPQVTLLWTASGVDGMTVYALNSASSVSSRGPIWFDNTVNSLLVDGTDLYVGGEFLEIGGTVSRKFGVISLSAGAVEPLLSATGSYISNPFSTGGDLGPLGSVDTIASNSTFLIVGGSFQGGFKGRGLCLYNKSTGVSYPFYVNGSVNSVQIIGNYLFVGGAFDYVNYGTQSASVVSGLRLTSNGLFRIDLTTVVSNPIASLSDISSIFSGPCTINSIAYSGTKIFVGGQFKINTNTTLTCQNLCCIDENGVRLAAWKPIINGPVYTLTVDDTTSDGGSIYLYVGGEFSRCFTDSEFNSNPRDNGAQTVYYNAVSYKIQTNSLLIQPVWKPKFNGPVTSFVTQDQDTNSEIYCYGRFTRINDEHQSYLCSVKKTSFTSDTSTGEYVYWKPTIQNGPSLINSSLTKYQNSVLVGGNFSKVNNNFRYNLAMISDVEGGISTVPLSSVSWDFGGKLVSQGTDYNFDFANTEVVRVSAYPAQYGIINYTTFASLSTDFKGNKEGQIVRFFVKRPGNSLAEGSLAATNDEMLIPIHVLGWKTDFNQ